MKRNPPSSEHGLDSGAEPLRLACSDLPATEVFRPRLVNPLTSLHRRIPFSSLEFAGDEGNVQTRRSGGSSLFKACYF